MECKHCGDSIKPDHEGSWIDSTDGDGCDNLTGVHQPHDTVQASNVVLTVWFDTDGAEHPANWNWQDLLDDDDTAVRLVVAD